MKKVAIQGIAGSYHEVAAREFFKNETIDIVECSSFPILFKEMQKDNTLFGAMAIENTIAGSLLQNHELLRKSDLRIIGEFKLRISHTLAALPGQKIEDLKEINSHPIALMQCDDFLEKHNHIKAVETDDTANSAKQIHDNQTAEIGAICSAHAAKLYGLDILAKGIETNKRNFTRFLILTDKCQAGDLTKGSEMNKASIVFCLPHTQGSLSKVLTILSFYGINLSKIQSLPIIGREWEYRFYVDLTFEDQQIYKQSLEAIKPLIKDFKILGEYAEAKQSI